MKFRVMNRDSDKKIVESFTCSNGKKLNSKTVDIIVDSINDDTFAGPFHTVAELLDDLESDEERISFWNDGPDCNPL